MEMVLAQITAEVDKLNKVQNSFKTESLTLGRFGGFL